MKVKAIRSEWFQDYKKPSMYIAFPNCTFKCEKECGKRVCQNSALASAQTIDVPVEIICQEYLSNPITQAIVCGGLEPFDSFDELLALVSYLRENGCKDNIIVYTGYTKEECISMGYLDKLISQDNIIIKFGRFIPLKTPHYDEVLGVNLASDNQYAISYSASANESR